MLATFAGALVRCWRRPSVVRDAVPGRQSSSTDGVQEEPFSTTDGRVRPPSAGHPRDPRQRGSAGRQSSSTDGVQEEPFSTTDGRVKPPSASPQRPSAAWIGGTAPQPRPALAQRKRGLGIRMALAAVGSPTNHAGGDCASALRLRDCRCAPRCRRATRRRRCRRRSPATSGDRGRVRLRCGRRPAAGCHRAAR